MNGPRIYTVCDLFCGAGGSSSGADRAIRAMGGEIELVAVNHWDIAIATHSHNHPEARHHCVNLDAARPEDLVPEGRLDLLMASPECTYHSRARGGKPIRDQLRMSAWHVQRWATALDVRCILVENVPEFVQWGPLNDADRPDLARRGQYFLAWFEAIKAMGYDVQWRLLNAADFGDATTRTRFFLQARKDGVPIRWPEPSHSATGSADMYGQRPRWRAAREVIDWDRPGGSLLRRKKPLSVKTRIRIARGLQRFGGPLAPLYIALLDLPSEDEAQFASTSAGEAEAFVSTFRNNVRPRGADEPLPTICAGTNHVSLVTPSVEPFIVANRANNVPRSVDEPTATATTTPGGGGLYLVDPQLVPYYRTGVARSVDEPVPTIMTKDRFGLVTPLVVPYGPKADARDVGRPLPTVLTKDRLAVATPTAEPFLVPQFGERDGQLPRVRDVEQPLPAVTGHGAGALVEPLVVKVNHGEGGGWGRSIDEPLPTVTATQRGLAVVEPTALPVAGDIDPRRLVLIDDVPHLLDIRFRMLSNRELARAMSFDDGAEEYQFSGNVGEVTRQIGNAVPVRTAAALVTAMLGDVVAKERAA